jgi:S1-C subfamily serine protease
MKKLFMVLLVIVALLVGTALASTLTVNDLSKYSVRIMSLGFGGIGRCTGTVIANTEENTAVLTCKHCIEVDKEFTVENQKVKKIISIPNEDIAYLVMNEPFKDKEAAPIAKEDVVEGAKVLMYGQPGYTIKHAKTGEVLYYTDDWGFAKLDVIAGCSGSGLFNEKGELVGVVWGAYSEGGGDEFAQLFGGDKGTPIGIFEPLRDVDKVLEVAEE